jgi:hypothetical protein
VLAVLFDPRSARVTFGDVATSWLAQRHDPRPKTRQDYQSALPLHLLLALAGIALGTTTPSTVRAWHASLAPGRPARAVKPCRLLHGTVATTVTDQRALVHPCQETRRRAREWSALLSPNPALERPLARPRRPRPVRSPPGSGQARGSAPAACTGTGSGGDGLGAERHPQGLGHRDAALATATETSTREILVGIRHAAHAAALRSQHATENRARAIGAALADLSGAPVEQHPRDQRDRAVRRSEGSWSANPLTREGIRADDGTRTRDPHLGKVMLYQLSHVRVRSHLTNPAGHG